MSHGIIEYLYTVREKHRVDINTFIKIWSRLAWRLLQRKQIRQAIINQHLLGFFLAIGAGLYTKNGSFFHKAFNELIGLNAYCLLLSVGAILVLITELFPLSLIKTINSIGCEAIRLCMAGAAIMAGVCAGMSLISMYYGDYVSLLLICIRGMILMGFVISYCLFGLTYHKACESVPAKPGRKACQLAALLVIISLTYWIFVS